MEIPKRIFLARLPTPIQKLNSVSRRLGKEIYLWRDDLTGFMDSGNKLRKLEFLLADALQKNCDWIITCGGPQSNHTRATAVVARQLGLDVSILTLPKPGYDQDQTATGNLMFNQIFATHQVWLSYEEFQKRGSTYDFFLNAEADRVRALGRKPYIIPLGGSNVLGCFGYANAVNEMVNTWRELVSGSNAPDHLFCALGSAGTYVGLQMGLEEQRLTTELHGINVIGPMPIPVQYVSNLRQSVLETYGIEPHTQQSQMIDGYVGAGYSIASDEDLKFYINLARTEGVMLDPCYTGKAFQGMVTEVEKNPSAYGKRILFLHSGGGFGNFAYAEQYQQVLKRLST